MTTPTLLGFWPRSGMRLGWPEIRPRRSIPRCRRRPRNRWSSRLAAWDQRQDGRIDTSVPAGFSFAIKVCPSATLGNRLLGDGKHVRLAERVAGSGAAMKIFPGVDADGRCCRLSPVAAEIGRKHGFSGGIQLDHERIRARKGNNSAWNAAIEKQVPLVNCVWRAPGVPEMSKRCRASEIGVAGCVDGHRGDGGTGRRRKGKVGLIRCERARESEEESGSQRMASFSHGLATLKLAQSCQPWRV